MVLLPMIYDIQFYCPLLHLYFHILEEGILLTTFQFTGVLS